MGTKAWIVTACLLSATPAAGAQGLVGGADAGLGGQVATTGASADEAPLFEQVSSQLWLDLGYALDGVSGTPELTGSGALASDESAGIHLANARAYAPCVLVISDSFGPTPYKGGLLVPVPAAMHVILRTDADGTVDVAFTWDVPVQSGVNIFMQFVIQDPAAIEGFALSNALALQTP